jgi:hypothetical protein
MVFQSYLDSSCKDELQDLFFMHHDQRRYRKRIQYLLKEFGIPELTESEQNVGMRLRGCIEGHQALLVTQHRGIPPVLAILILVTRPPVLHVVHWVNNLSKTADNMNLEILSKLTSLAEHLNGISEISIEYSGLVVSVVQAKRIFTPLV